MNFFQGSVPKHTGKMSPNPLSLTQNIILSSENSACKENMRCISVDIRRHESIFFTNYPASSGVNPEAVASALLSEEKSPVSSASAVGNLVYFTVSDTVCESFFSSSSGMQSVPPCLPDDKNYLKYMISVISDTYAPQPGGLSPDDMPLARLLIYIDYTGFPTPGLIRELKYLSGKILSSRAYTSLTLSQHSLLKKAAEYL